MKGLMILEISDLDLYVRKLNRALRQGKGICFFPNQSVLVRNPPGISLDNWDFVSNFDFGRCDSCGGSAFRFRGIDGPYLDDLFFVEKGVPYRGYSGRISLPKTFPYRLLRDDREVIPKYNKANAPIIGELKIHPKHLHGGQAEGFLFNGEERVIFHE
jgi:hypothetical protein